MRYMTSVEIRNTWLEFFKSKGHTIEPSASLVPVNDPTLLWINAGVAPLKKYFDGSTKPLSTRLTNIQKCIRTNDIENVGLTARHHTFFEMLGNFSIGDYFKKEAIDYAFEILTDEKYFGFPIEKLYFTYFPADLDTKNFWMSKGVLEHHIIPVEGNFWEIGEGSCGPCSEIFFDRGISYDTRGSELILNDIENDRYIEIWNIVFAQFNAKKGLKRSEYPELPNKNIDTGAGLERFACVLQGSETNFETDLFLPIIKSVETHSGVAYSGQKEFKIIADHVRTLTLSISDGAMLSNEGRGYVLRRLLRRALKHGLSLGLKEPFLYKMVSVVAKMMEDFYPNVLTQQEMIEKIILKEEQKFLETLVEGEKLLASLIKEHNHQTLSGDLAFKLYDTYGFPIELTLEYAHEMGVEVDKDGFYEALEAQKMRSRQARKNLDSMGLQNEALLEFKTPSKFVGYDTFSVTTKVTKIFEQGIVLEQTPFYATSGGQVCDLGIINDYPVLEVSKLPNGQFLHVLDHHDLVEGDTVFAQIDLDNRLLISQNHSATHLLHQALKDVLGTHAHQQGSLVNAQSLRFDFNHFESITASDVLKIERIVKSKIIENLNVDISWMNIEEAKQLGAMALFGEKYGNIVRVVNMNRYSIELCGGTHVKNTFDIVDFAITQIESIGSGIYRIEAVSGNDITTRIKEKLANLSSEITQAKNRAKALGYKKQILNKAVVGSYQDLLNASDTLLELREILKGFEKQAREENQKDALKNVFDYITSNHQKQLIRTHLPSDVLKQAMDMIFDKLAAQTIFMVNQHEGKTTFLCKTDGQTNAGDLIKLAAKLTNGSGGGKPTLAQGGTSNIEHLEDAIIQVTNAL